MGFFGARELWGRDAEQDPSSKVPAQRTSGGRVLLRLWKKGKTRCALNSCGSHQPVVTCEWPVLRRL